MSTFFLITSFCLYSSRWSYHAMRGHLLALLTSSSNRLHSSQHLWLIRSSSLRWSILSLFVWQSSSLWQLLIVCLPPLNHQIVIMKRVSFDLRLQILSLEAHSLGFLTKSSSEAASYAQSFHIEVNNYQLLFSVSLLTI